MRLRTIVLSGVTGSGKTTVLCEIGEVLEERGEPYALVDLDWLAWLRPGPGSALTVQDVLAENLRAVSTTFLRAGVDRLVLARFLESRAELDAIHRGLPESEFLVVRLTAPADVLEERLRHRDSGRELAEHLAFVSSAWTPNLEDAVVESGGGRPPRAAAIEILTAAGWLAGGPTSR